MSKLSFVYFDVGGVAIQDFSDSPKWDVMLTAMGLPLHEVNAIDSLYDQYEDEVCMGKRHIDSLVPLYKDKYSLTIPDNFSMQQYFIDHFDPNPKLWPLIAKLRQTTQLGLLTDQYPGMLDGIIAKQLLPPVQWDVIIDSSVEGVRKPMPEIYQLAQTQAVVPAEEILFIDNREKNLVVPRVMGWQTFLYDSSNYDQANQELATFINTFAI